VKRDKYYWRRARFYVGLNKKRTGQLRTYQNPGSISDLIRSSLGSPFDRGSTAARSEAQTTTHRSSLGSDPSDTTLHHQQSGMEGYVGRVLSCSTSTRRSKCMISKPSAVIERLALGGRHARVLVRVVRSWLRSQVTIHEFRPLNLATLDGGTQHADMSIVVRPSFNENWEECCGLRDDETGIFRNKGVKL